MRLGEWAESSSQPVRETKNQMRLTLKPDYSPMQSIKTCLFAVVVLFSLVFSNRTAHAGQFDAEAVDLQAAWNLMAQCRPVYDGHRWWAMDRVADAGRIIGVTFQGPRSGTLPKEQARPKLVQARSLIQRAQSSLAAKRKPVAADKCARAVYQLDLAIAVR